MECGEVSGNWDVSSERRTRDGLVATGLMSWRGVGVFRKRGADRTDCRNLTHSSERTPFRSRRPTTTTTHPLRRRHTAAQSKTRQNGETAPRYRHYHAPGGCPANGYVLQSSGKVKANQLVGKSKEDLKKQLDDLKTELVGLRTQKIAGGASSKLTKMYDFPIPGPGNCAHDAAWRMQHPHHTRN